MARDESGSPNETRWWLGTIYYLNGDMVDVRHDVDGAVYPYPRETVLPLGLPTLTKNDAKNTGSPGRLRRRTVPLDGQVRGPLSPMWSEFVMGWPVGATDAMQPLVMDNALNPWWSRFAPCLRWQHSRCKGGE